MPEGKWNKEIQAKITARAWKDEGFRSKLVNNPREVLKEYGIELPGNVEIKICQEDATHFYFVLPPVPADIKSLSEDELGKLSAAWGGSTNPNLCMGGGDC